MREMSAEFDDVAARLRMEVARALRRARGKRSQVAWVKELAPHLGRVPDPTHWSRYENGQVDPPAYVLLAAARAAGVSVSLLLDEPEATPNQLMQKLNELSTLLEEARRPAGWIRD
jgi:transcriptional regulator with XRE-family HTH domain